MVAWKETALDSSEYCLSIKEAAERWPPLQSFVSSGKINLGDPLALTEYNKALMYAITGFTLTIPKGKLIPAVCLRFTYLKYLRDRFPEYRVLLDIGTGASAILAIIGQFLGYKVLATEIDSDSIEWATKNIKNNGLTIPIFKSEGGLLNGVIPRGQLSEIEVAVTYPPFYPADRPGRTSKKIRGFKGSDSELFGGTSGFEFTRSYLDECCDLEIPLPTVLLHKKEFASRAIHLFPSNYSVEVIPIKAGTRLRYMVLGELRK